MKHELDSLKGERNYKGCLVRRIIGGFEVFGVRCLTGQEVDNVIAKSAQIIQNSITVVNDGSGTITVSHGNGVNLD